MITHWKTLCSKTKEKAISRQINYSDLYCLNKDVKSSLMQYQLRSSLLVAKNIKPTKLLICSITERRENKPYYQFAKIIIEMNQIPAVSLLMTISEEAALSISGYTDSPKLLSQTG